MKRLSAKLEWTGVILLALTWGFVALNRIGIAFLFPYIKPAFHLNYAEVGLLLSGTSATWALSALFGGFLGDKLGFKKLYLGCMVAAALFSAVIGATWNFVSIFIVRDLVGIGDGAGWSIGQSMVAKISTPKRRALNLGIFAAGYTIVGVGAGSVIMTQLAVHFGWRNVFWIIAIPAVIIVAILWKILPTIRPKDMADIEGTGTTEKRSYKELLTNPQMILLIIINIVILGWIQGFNGYSALFLHARHYPITEIGFILSIGGILGCVGQLLLPSISNFVGRKTVTLVCLALPALATIFMSTAHVGTAGLAVCIAVIGFFAWAVIPLASATIISEMVPSSQLASAMGVTNFFGVALGSFVFPPVLGVIADHHGLSAAFLTIGIVLAAGAVCTIFLRETRVKALAGAEISSPAS